MFETPTVAAKCFHFKALPQFQLRMFLKCEICCLVTKHALPAQTEKQNIYFFAKIIFQHSKKSAAAIDLK